MLNKVEYSLVRGRLPCWGTFPHMKFSVVSNVSSVRFWGRGATSVKGFLVAFVGRAVTGFDGKGGVIENA